MNVNTDTLIDIKAVIMLANLTPAAIYARIKAGTFPAGVKIGNARMWYKEEIEAWTAVNR